ncbi:hypothetical protein FQN54_003323 [Arachnomyces sp. PD_36]|nr:hypothetical protein FQN54_003323 [Arachnomyces sp. PD_36]
MASLTAVTKGSFLRASALKSCQNSGSSLLRFNDKFSYAYASSSQVSSNRGRLWGTRNVHSGGSKPRISYRIAACSSGKDSVFHPDRSLLAYDPDVQDTLGVQLKGNQRSKKKSRPDCGEDAYFVSKVGGDSGAFAFGVADGVGGWVRSGIDPADFSHGLCGYMAETALDWDRPVNSLRARELMQRGYQKVLDDKSIFAGGSTASIGIAREDGSLELANLGDSGSIHCRLAAVHHYSIPQTHAFNTPYQLSKIPTPMRTQVAIFGGQRYDDLPQHANIMNTTMQHGDVLVLSTDGVLDNLNNQEILKMVSTRMMAKKAWVGKPDQGISVSDEFDSLTRRDPTSTGAEAPSSTSFVAPGRDIKNSDYTLQELLASNITRRAKLASLDLRRDGPFAKEALRQFPNEPFHGGKVDDITVVVVIAVEEGRAERGEPGELKL